MDVYRPLRAGLFFYEVLRVFFLVILVRAAAPEGNGAGAFFPYPAFLSSNALFPLALLFVWLRPGEYRNYLSLYLAGKIIALVTFYAWEFFSSREFPGTEQAAKSLFLLRGSVIISLTDIFSIAGAWALKTKWRRTAAPEAGGI